jgi:regulator of protease activity HflC (stomatin/prohibitin superfamily)
MGLFSLVVLIVAIIVAIIIICADQSKQTLTVAGIIFLLGVIIFIFLNLVAIIPTGEVGVIRTFGETTHVIYPGLNFVIPIVNSVIIYDVKTRETPITFQAYSKDAQTVTGLLNVQYRIRPEYVMDINEQFGSINALEQRMNAITIERAKSVFADKGAMEIVETRSILSSEIEDRITPALEIYHIDLITVALADISFNTAFEHAVELKMIAEQEKLRAEYDKERAIIKGEEQLEVAKLESQAVIAKSHGDAEALSIMQRAWTAPAQEVKDAMLQQQFYERWNGILPSTFLSGEHGISLIVP